MLKHQPETEWRCTPLHALRLTVRVRFAQPFLLAAKRPGGLLHCVIMMRERLHPQLVGVLGWVYLGLVLPPVAAGHSPDYVVGICCRGNLAR